MDCFRNQKDNIIRVYNILALGSGFLSKVQILLLFFWPKIMSIRYIWRISKYIPYIFKNIRMRNADNSATNIIHLHSGSEIKIFRGIFIDKEYEIDMKYKPGIIFDIGSNIGLSIIYFRHKYPEAKIFGFEPNPRAFVRLKEAVNKIKDVKVFNIAISDKNGEEKCFLHSKISSSSLLERVPGQECVIVETKTLDDVMEDLAMDNIDLLKFDVEGSEARIFSSFRNLCKINKIIGEVHLDLMDVAKEEFLNNFEAFSVNIDWLNARRFLMRATIIR
jgi:FkbM family methyltransferase